MRAFLCLVRFWQALVLWCYDAVLFGIFESFIIVSDDWEWLRCVFVHCQKGKFSLRVLLEIMRAVERLRVSSQIVGFCETLHTYIHFMKSKYRVVRQPQTGILPYQVGGFKVPGYETEKENKRYVYSSQTQLYNEYRIENPENFVSKTYFKKIMGKNNFCRARGVVDACPICECLYENISPTECVAQEQHKQLVVKIGVGLQVVEDYLPKGVYFF
jgi:hypothetical protein